MPLPGEKFDQDLADRLKKPARGSHRLAREEKRADEDRELEAATKEAKSRDGKCRFPVKHKCRGQLEGAHVKDKSTGGRASNVASNLITVCYWIHRGGPQSIHGGDYEVQPLTERGTHGPVAVFRRVWHEGRRGESELFLIAQEKLIHVWEHA